MYRIALHQVRAHASVTCACPACPLCYIVYCTYMHSNICLGASHLGTLDVQRVDVDHVLTETEPQDGVGWTRPKE